MKKLRQAIDGLKNVEINMELVDAKAKLLRDQF